MALIADDAADRAAQLLLVTQRLAHLVSEDTRRIEARLPILEGAEADEKQRLANAYRLELARIKHDRSLIDGAPPALLTQLREATVLLHANFDQHEIALNAVKNISEGLVQAMAEEVVRQRNGGANYGSDGALETPPGPAPAVVDHRA